MSIGQIPRGWRHDGLLGHDNAPIMSDGFPHIFLTDEIGNRRRWLTFASRVPKICGDLGLNARGRHLVSRGIRRPGGGFRQDRGSSAR